MHRSRSSRGRYVSAYANCGAAMRRDVYLKLAGFPRFFGHMYEEPDYALQCYAADFAVWFEPDLVVRHHLVEGQSTRRPTPAPARSQRVLERSDPLPLAVPSAVALFRIWRQLRYAALRALGRAIAARLVARRPAWSAANASRAATPVPGPEYWAWMTLAAAARLSLGRPRQSYGCGHLNHEVPRLAPGPRRGRHHRPVLCAIC